MWKICLYYVLLFVKYCENVHEGNDMNFLPRRNVLNIISDIMDPEPSQSTVATAKAVPDSTAVPVTSVNNDMILGFGLGITTAVTGFAADVGESKNGAAESSSLENKSTPFQPAAAYPVLHASVPRALAVYPAPLAEADHELLFNVSWLPGLGPPARDYSLEVRSVTNTPDCNTPMCYEYNIPGEARWWTMPAVRHPVLDTCAVKPGCKYHVRLIAHPWDGHTSANIEVELDECVAGVCSCAHAPRLPAPLLASADMMVVRGEFFVNITWSLPPPSQPLRLPRGLNKQYYFVSIGKQMVSDAHPAPWFAYSVSRQVTASGSVALGDTSHWFLLPVTERKPGERRGHKINVKLLARVSLIDDRGCIGPAGNATAFDPNDSRKSQVATYALWSVFGGACMLAMVAVVAVSSQAMKKILRKLRSSPISDPLEPRSRNAWFPLHINT